MKSRYKICQFTFSQSKNGPIQIHEKPIGGHLNETKTRVKKSEDRIWKRTKKLESCLGTGVETPGPVFHLAEPPPSRRIMGSVTETINDVYLISKREESRLVLFSQFERNIIHG